MAHSRDLINWSKQQFVPVMKHEPESKNCWAPEITWDPEGRQYVIYWATTIPGHFGVTAETGDGDWNHRMYCTTTRDFQTYTPTRLFYEPGFNVIDSTITRHGDRYVMVLKDETRHPPAKNLRVATSDKVTGPWSEASAPFTPKDLWVEGPTCTRIGDHWYVYYDAYAKGHYGAMRTRDFKEWEDVTGQLRYPRGMRHGTVLSVSPDAVKTLLKKEKGVSIHAKPETIIQIDASNPGIRMSKNLWGIFFEEINFAGDGGLYAELIRNRSFESSKNPLEAWSTYKRNARGKIDIDTEARLNEVRKQALRVHVDSVRSGGEFAVVNSGYWGVPLRKGETYTFSLFAKSDSSLVGKRLQVSLRNAKGDRTYALATLGKLGSDWQELTCTLQSNATDFDGRLFVSTGDVGVFWLDVVSLFPPTWKNQPNGLRPDLANLLAELKPSFFRFPGGCFSEGDTLENAFK
ncbi:MAG: family 43 glycosylhydrolase, partial [Rhodospirillales bacterium]|nr:family 43 glycosylhydrolase [Rhodospirillales bacterium]